LFFQTGILEKNKKKAILFLHIYDKFDQQFGKDPDWILY
jgi:hypothetical protein